MVSTNRAMSQLHNFERGNHNPIVFVGQIRRLGVMAIVAWATDRMVLKDATAGIVLE